MLLVIDAYNLLKFMVKSAHVSKTQHTVFINTLAAYALIKKHELLVVFDGGDTYKHERFAYKGISIVYAGQRSTADDFIKSYVEDKKIKSELLIVSSDKNLCDYIGRLGASCIEAPLFSLLLNEALLTRSSPDKKESSVFKSKDYESSPELDALMVEASSRSIKKEESEEVSLKSGKKKTLSKYEKNIHKIVKKL